MYDHFKPTVREFNPDHLIISVRTNKLNFSETVRQILRSIIDFTLSLKPEENTVTILLIFSRNDSLYNKAHWENTQLLNMCCPRNTLSWYKRYFKESKFNLNKSGAVEFAKSVFKYLLQQDSYSADNSGIKILEKDKG